MTLINNLFLYLEAVQEAEAGAEYLSPAAVSYVDAEGGAGP